MVRIWAGENEYGAIRTTAPTSANAAANRMEKKGMDVDEGILAKMTHLLSKTRESERSARSRLNVAEEAKPPEPPGVVPCEGSRRTSQEGRGFWRRAGRRERKGPWVFPVDQHQQHAFDSAAGSPSGGGWFF